MNFIIEPVNGRRGGRRVKDERDTGRRRRRRGGKMHRFLQRKVLEVLVSLYYTRKCRLLSDRNRQCPWEKEKNRMLVREVSAQYLCLLCTLEKGTVNLKGIKRRPLTNLTTTVTIYSPLHSIRQSVCTRCVCVCVSWSLCAINDFCIFCLYVQ